MLPDIDFHTLHARCEQNCLPRRCDASLFGEASLHVLRGGEVTGAGEGVIRELWSERRQKQVEVEEMAEF